MRQLYPKVVRHFREEMNFLDDASLGDELGNLLEMAETDDIPIEKSEKGEKIENGQDSKKRKAEDEKDANNNNNTGNAPAKKGRLTGK